MSTKANKTSQEAPRTRKSSQRTKNSSSTSNIVEAFKMADSKDKTQKGKVSSLESINTQNEKQCEENVENVDMGAAKEDEELLTLADKREILEAIRELSEKFTCLDNSLNDPVKGVATQLVALNLRCDTLYNDIHGESSGILEVMASNKTEFEQKIDHVEQAQKRFSAILAENKKIALDLTTMQGLLQKFSQKIHTSEMKILDLTRRGMEQNIIIHGIEEAPEPANEDCFESVMNFVKGNLEMDLDESDIWKVYRMGNLASNRSRPMFVKLSYYGKDAIMDRVGALKGKRNKNGQVLFISEQIPEGITETRKQVAQRAKALRDVEASKQPDNRREVKVMGDRIVVGGEVDRPEVMTPQPYELFPGLDEQKKITALNQQILETAPSYNKNSTFIGLAVKVSTINQVNLAYKAVMQRFPFMDHVMMAYRILAEDGVRMKSGGCDDMEFGGGDCIKQFLISKKQSGLAVFVVRRYGGIHLGYDRFRVIEQTAKTAVYKLTQDEQFAT